jgi:hypothetical protein
VNGVGDIQLCSFQDLLTSTAKLAEECYRRQGSQNLLSALDDIRSYGTILDVFTQGWPGPVSAGWGMVRVIVEVSQVVVLLHFVNFWKVRPRPKICDQFVA